MVIDNLNIGGAGGRPDKANAPLPVYPHRMLPSPTAFQFFQMVAGWEAQIFQDNRCIKRCEHRPGALHQVTGEAFAILALNGISGAFSPGTLDYVRCVSLRDTCVKV